MPCNKAVVVEAENRVWRVRLVVQKTVVQGIVSGSGGEGRSKGQSNKVIDAKKVCDGKEPAGALSDGIRALASNK